MQQQHHQRSRPRRRRTRRRLLGLLAGPILVGSCAPVQQCAPAPPAPTTTTRPRPAPTTTAPRPTTTVPRPTTTVPRPTTTTLPPTTTTLPAPVRGRDYEFLWSSTSGAYSRWDPCGDPITYRIADGQYPPTAEEAQAVRDALATAAAATGFEFRELGAGEPPEAAEAVIEFTRFAVPGQLGEGGGDVDRTTGEIVSGIVRVAKDLPAASRRYALLHEIGHMLGLGHIDNVRELMHQFVVDPPKQDYQRGDREGLRLVGTTMPCFVSMLRTQGAEGDRPVVRVVVE